LSLPSGYPSSINFDVLERIIHLCHEVGAQKIRIGSFTLKGMTIKEISDTLGLKDYLKKLDSELVFLDKSNYSNQGNLSTEELEIIKKRSLTSAQVREKEFKIPKIINDSEKLIYLNQVNVHPIFDLTLSMLNSSSIALKKRDAEKKKTKYEEKSTFIEQIKQKQIENILDVFLIKKPNLIINDSFYVLEGAGPYIYKDSNLKRLETLIVGNDAFYTDLITLKILNFDYSLNDLILEAKERGLGSFDYSNVTIHSDSYETDIIIKPCVSNLTDINVNNISVCQGNACCRCHEQAYYLLNFMKTFMTKDLKYISKNSFLIGENPPSPKILGQHIILFGDCAIERSKDQNFRTLLIEGKKKATKNKKILELPGCPPRFLECLPIMVNYYGKSNVPLLNLFLNMHELSPKEKIEEWEVLI